ncbi:MAG: chromate transporter [Eubacterium sp.]|nr:chromate transporter [Eubacterium sp.]
MRVLLLLYYEFFKTGLFAVGGGMATLPFLYELSDKYGWFTRAELADMVAVSESTPGPIGINMATYAGWKACGIPGGIVATLGIITPSAIIIILIARMMARFRESRMADHIMTGVRPAATGLIASAGYGLFMEVFCTGSLLTAGIFAFDLKALAVFAVALAGVFLLDKIHPIAFVAAGAVAGILFSL